MEPLSNLTSHNARVAQIRKFVCKPPPRGVRLRLVTADDTAESLGEWLREECEGNANVANDVSETLQEHCNTAERPIEALLGWCADEGNAVTTKRLRARPASGDDLEAKALGIDGTAGGQVVQMQRHLEAMTRSYLTAHQAQIHSANLIATTMSDRVLQLQQQLDEAREERNELFLAQIEKIMGGDAAEEPATVGPETDAARAELIRTTVAGLKTAGPLVLRQVLQWAAEQQAKKAAAAAASS